MDGASGGVCVLYSNLLLHRILSYFFAQVMKKCMELVAESMTDNLSLMELTKLVSSCLRYAYDVLRCESISR